MLRVCVSVDLGDTGSANGQILINYNSDNTLGSTTFAGDGIDGSFIGGLQIETTKVCTSYIRTEGAVVTRSRDEVNANIMTLGNALSVLSEHSYLGGSDVDNGNRNVYVLSDGTVNNRYGVRNINNANGFLSATNGAAEIFFGDSTVLANGVSANIAVTITPNNVLMYNNGILSATEDPADINPLPQGINVITFNTNTVGGGLHLNGHIKRIQVYDVELTASEVKVL
jgi:hypothetical protein